MVCAGGENPPVKQPPRSLQFLSLRADGISWLSGTLVVPPPPPRPPLPSTVAPPPLYVWAGIQTGDDSAQDVLQVVLSFSPARASWSPEIWYVPSRGQPVTVGPSDPLHGGRPWKAGEELDFAFSLSREGQWDVFFGPLRMTVHVARAHRMAVPVAVESFRGSPPCPPSVTVKNLRILDTFLRSLTTSSLVKSSQGSLPPCTTKLQIEDIG